MAVLATLFGLLLLAPSVVVAASPFKQEAPGEEWWKWSNSPEFVRGAAAGGAFSHFWDVRIAALNNPRPAFGQLTIKDVMDGPALVRPLVE